MGINQRLPGRLINDKRSLISRIAIGLGLGLLSSFIMIMIATCYVFKIKHHF